MADRNSVIQNLPQSPTDPLLENLLCAINHASIALEWVDCNTGRFLKVNEFAASLHDMTVAEMTGTLLWDIDPLFDQQKFNEFVAQLRKNKTAYLETVHKDKAGRQFPIEVNISYRGEESGIPEHFVAFIRDISERKQKQIELEHALQQADAANQAKSDFLANMSHEIRTPMNGVLGIIQILAQQIDDPEQSLLLSKAILSGKSLLAIVNDILDFSKIETGKLELEIAPLKFSQVMELVISEMTPLAVNKNIKLSVITEENFIDTWLGDFVRVKQILLNLVSNAVKFTHDSEVVIKVDMPQVDDQRQLSFSVIDSGIGMSPEAIAKLFLRFEQADSSTTRKYGGTGLGMAITQSLIDLMAGKITVASELGKGTTMTVTLPLSCTDEKVTSNIECKITVPDLTGKKILIAEDNTLNQMIVETMLLPTKAQIQLANHGEEAIEFMQTFKPDIVFLDIQMPVLDGIETIIQLRRTYTAIPIIALTANVFTADINHYKSIGFNHHVAKPIIMDELYHALEQYCGAD